MRRLWRVSTILLGITILLTRSLAGQINGDVEVQDSARRTLGISGSQPLWLERTYIPEFFGDIPFYRARYHNPAHVDVPPRTFAAALLDSRLLVVRSFSDLGTVWAEGFRDAGTHRLVGAGFARACLSLLIATGYLSGQARVVEARSEIPRGAVGRLLPQRALGRIGRGRDSADARGRTAVRYVWDSDLLRIDCTLEYPAVFGVRVDTLATGPDNSP